MLWKHIWTSCLINVNRTIHPYFITAAGATSSACYPSATASSRSSSASFQANKKVTQFEHQISKQTNLDGLIDAFKIITNHYTNNTDFISLECVSPNVAVLLNHHNHKKHSIHTLECNYEVLRIRRIPKEVRSIDNPFFGMCKKKISYELLCGMVGPETSDMIAKPHRVEMDVKIMTKELHTLSTSLSAKTIGGANKKNSGTNKKFIINNIHYWKFCSDIDKIEWILDDISHHSYV